MDPSREVIATVSKYSLSSSSEKYFRQIEESSFLLLYTEDYAHLHCHTQQLGLHWEINLQRIHVMMHS